MLEESMGKRLLFVVNVDWFFISHRLPLALEGIKRGYEVHLACGITDKKEFLNKLGLKVHPLHISRGTAHLTEEIKTFVEIYKVLKNVSPDIAHFVTIKPILYGGVACRFLNIRKKVFAISGLGFTFVKQGLKWKILRTVIKRMYRLALGNKYSHVIVQNPDDKYFVNSIVNVPITLIPGSGVDLSQYRYTQENNRNVKVVMASRLLKDKGVFEFVEAAKILKLKYPNVEFALYGDIDPYNPSSLTKVDIDNIKKEGVVNIYGYSSNIAKVFSDSNIIVLPSYYREGLPKVLIEAAACGRAVVTTNVPGCRDAIEPNITGLLCEPKNVHSLVEQIEKLILDEQLRNSMGKAGRNLAEREFDIQKVVEKHFEIYEKEL